MSKYNKAASESGGSRADAAKIGDIIANELNLRLEDEGESGQMVRSEVLKFEAVNGFLNVFL